MDEENDVAGREGEKENRKNRRDRVIRVKVSNSDYLVRSSYTVIS